MLKFYYHQAPNPAKVALLLAETVRFMFPTLAAMSGQNRT